MIEGTTLEYQRKGKVVVMEISDRERVAIGKVYKHMIHDEKKHWEESGRPVNHVYVYLRDLADIANKEGNMVVKTERGSITILRG